MPDSRTLASIGFLFAAAAMAQTTGRGPRTPDGRPDFQGIWDNVTLTPLERGIVEGPDNKPIPLPPVTTLTIADAEATAYEQHIKTGLDFKPGDGSAANLSGEENAAFQEPAEGLARVSGAKRTSLIVDPADGRIPYVASEEDRKRSPRSWGFDSVKDRPLPERCLHSPLNGPPINSPPTHFADYQIVQTPDYVVIMAEYQSEARIVRIGGQHMGPGVRQWLGDSIGHWEGDTLVVDTTNFSARTHFKGATENLHVVEQFQLIDGDTFLYRATVEDPSVFSKPWVIEYPFRRARGPLYEYACHEGNYSLIDILKGARKAEADTAKK